jgi:Zn-finger nucleic acid-binding protein
MAFRSCPDCNKPMTPTKRAFAELDVCADCGGTFLDSGEGVATFGPDAELRFLLADGRAKRLHASRRKCPAGHAAMTTFAIKRPDGSGVDVDLCEECGGFFFDAGEGEALAALDAAPKGTFAMPPRQSSEDFAITAARQDNRSFFARFVVDFLGGGGGEKR